MTLLEVSFVFLPCLMQVPLAWGEDSSSDQHSSVQAPNAAASCCTQGEQQQAQQGKQQRAQQGKQQRSIVQQQWHAAAAAAAAAAMQQQQQHAAKAELQDQWTAWHYREGGATIHHDRI